MAARIERELRQVVNESDHEAFLLTMHPRVAACFLGPQGEDVERLEQTTNRALFVRADPRMHIEEYRILPGDLQEMERQIVRYRPGQVVECQVEKEPIVAQPRAVGWCEGYYVDLQNGGSYLGERVKARLIHVHRSFAIGEVVPAAKTIDKAEPI
jgi:hypothetical protein